MYRLALNRSFRRAYAKLPPVIQRETDEQIRRLCVDPHHPSLHTHKRKGEEGLWQARITRSYRLYSAMEGGIITLMHVGAHEK